MKKTRNLQSRIWLLALSVLFVSVAVFSLASAEIYYKSSVDDGKNYLRVYMNEFSPEVYTLDEAGARAYSQKLNGARVTFMDGQGRVIADSMAENPVADHSDRPEVISAITGGVNGDGFSVRESSTLGKNAIYYCKNFNGEYLVRVAIFTDAGWLLFVKTIPTLIPFMIALTVVSVAIAAIVTNRVITPVKRLASDAVYNDCIDCEYEELKPVAELLNERNRRINKQMQELSKEKEEVVRARESKDEFISNVTHEMNTPLTSIRGYAELLAAGGMTEEQKELAYKTLSAQSERLTGLITCIINYSEIESENLPFYEVDFSALALETLCAIKPEADKRGITFVEKISEGVCVLSRHEYASEVLGNLVRNAVKYNKDGGSVTVTLNGQKLEVEDTGIGIADENKEKVFSRFFTVDKSRGGKNGGFGLGLAVVKKICRKCGWDIRFESVLGEGSKFTVYFSGGDGK